MSWKKALLIKKACKYEYILYSTYHSFTLVCRNPFKAYQIIVFKILDKTACLKFRSYYYYCFHYYFYYQYHCYYYYYFYYFCYFVGVAHWICLRSVVKFLEVLCQQDSSNLENISEDPSRGLSPPKIFKISKFFFLGIFVV